MKWSVPKNAANNPFRRMGPSALPSVHPQEPQDDLNGLIASSSESYTTPEYSMPAWNELVIYELHIGTFSQGGGINGRGSFASASTKLDYLQNLGINAIEILPLGEYIGDISSG